MPRGAPPPGAVAARRAAGESRPGRGGAGRAADRARGGGDAGADEPRPQGGAGRGGPRARAEERPAGVPGRPRADHRGAAPGAVRVSAVRTILRKDLRLELRTLETVP